MYFYFQFFCPMVSTHLTNLPCGFDDFPKFHNPFHFTIVSHNHAISQALHRLLCDRALVPGLLVSRVPQLRSLQPGVGGDGQLRGHRGQPDLPLPHRVPGLRQFKHDANVFPSFCFI